MFALIVCAFVLISITGAAEGRVSQEQVKQFCEQNGYKLHNTGCYKLHDVAVSWDTASSRCAAEGAHLVIINDSTEAETITNIAKDSSGSYDWVGIRDESGNDSWKSVNGDKIDDLYHVWDDSHTGKYKCGALMYTGKIDDLPCHTERSFICEK